MKKNTKLIIIILTLLLVVTLGFLGWFYLGKDELLPEKDVNSQDESSVVKEPRSVVEPLKDSRNRITKKPFGIYITRENSPVQPERFSGFHTGVDFEVTKAEIPKDVLVYSVCSGQIVRKINVSGYGGVIVQACNLDGQPVTIVYGHLSLSKTKYQELDKVEMGDMFSVLGDDKSKDTDGERKHLHLGIHKGTVINYSGYVGVESQLSDWIDIEDLLNE